MIPVSNIPPQVVSFFRDNGFSDAIPGNSPTSAFIGTNVFKLVVSAQLAAYRTTGKNLNTGEVLLLLYNHVQHATEQHQGLEQPRQRFRPFRRDNGDAHHAFGKYRPNLKPVRDHHTQRTGDSIRTGTGSFWDTVAEAGKRPGWLIVPSAQQKERVVLSVSNLGRLESGGAPQTSGATALL